MNEATTRSPQLYCTCGCPLVAGMTQCAVCWQRFRAEAMAHREQRQAQEAKRNEAKGQGKIGEWK